VKRKQSRHVRISIGEKLNPLPFQSGETPPKEILWSSFSFRGVGSLVPVDGMMISDKYVDVIQSKVIPHMRETFREGGAYHSKILLHAMHRKM